MTAWLLVALGAAAGAVVRYLVTLRMGAGTSTMPATLSVNVGGSLGLGLLAGAAVGGRPYALLGVGFCGALTTFSTLAYEVLDGTRTGGGRLAATYLALSVGGGVAALAAGWMLAA